MRIIFTGIVIFVFYSTTFPVSQSSNDCSSQGCHKSLIDFKVIHTATEDDCLNCHNILYDNHPSKDHNDITLMDDSPELCFICHDDIVVSEEDKSIHPPFEEDCLNCHSPHASDYEFMLNDALPGQCFMCHDNPAENENVKSFHRAIIVEKKCINCHTPHHSQYGYLLKDEEIKMCLSCHNKRMEYGDNRIKNIAEKIISEDYAHPPVVIDGCSACHSPHSSQYRSLLVDTFPQTAYASGEEGNYNLCFTCHDEAAITLQFTFSQTNFRNGNSNLHYIHVNRDKSRSCINCHDVHGSRNQYLILESTSFGEWDMKLNYRVTETGGSCLPGCHKELVYDRTISN